MSEYSPHPGNNQPGRRSRRRSLDSESFANKDFLTNAINRLIGLCDNLQVQLENELDAFALPVRSSDAKLNEAHRAEWPVEQFGYYSEQITYDYYKALRLRKTATASYIRKRYEEAARDVTGTNALDLLILTDLTKTEALLIQEFVSKHVGSVNDSSEQRLLEVFQGWVQPSIVHIQDLRTYSTSSLEEPLSDKELRQTSQGQAKHGQAVSKVKLNAANDEILKRFNFLKKNFSEHGSIFYNRFLGPAMDYRLGVTTKAFPNPGNKRLDNEIIRSSDALDLTLKSAIADQSRRRVLYHSTVTELKEKIRVRDRYKATIVQLSSLGKPLPQDDIRSMQPTSPIAEEKEYFQNVDSPNFDLSGGSNSLEGQGDQGTLTSSHSNLSDLDFNDDHPQYLLKEGGTVTGPIEFGPNALIDGIVPSTHRHTGADGSAQIHGEDIIGGTLSDDAVNREKLPVTPTDLRVVSFEERIVPPGVAMIDTLVAWEGDFNNSFEVQIALVDD